MGLSETIVAAIIGALATMGTAIFQLVRNRAPSETRPKKNRTRSVLATIALMIGCIVGGYAWSALRAVSAKEEMRATMQEEFTRQFAEFAARQNQPAATTDPAGGTLASGNRDAGAAESVAQLPPCKIDAHPDEVGPVICTERDAQPIALCAAIPADAQTSNIRVQARVPLPWIQPDPAWLARQQAAGRPAVRFGDIPLEWSDLRLTFRQTADILRRYDALELADHQQILSLSRDGNTLEPIVSRWYLATSGVDDDAPGPRSISRIFLPLSADGKTVDMLMIGQKASRDLRSKQSAWQANPPTITEEVELRLP